MEKTSPMNLAASIAESFGRSFDLYRDLVDSLDEETLAAKLPGLPSNSLGSQLWCVVGARESYTVALREKAWSGFSCSLQTTTEKLPVSAALLSSAEGVRGMLDSVSSFTEAQNRLLIALLEHEVAHQGQLILYLYGLRLAIPESWKKKYALE